MTETVADRLTRRQVAWRVAQDIEDGNYVNLGIGMPEQVANYLPKDLEIVFHSENGILGMGPELVDRRPGCDSRCRRCDGPRGRCPPGVRDDRSQHQKG